MRSASAQHITYLAGCDHLLQMSHAAPHCLASGYHELAFVRSPGRNHIVVVTGAAGACATSLPGFLPELLPESSPTQPDRPRSTNKLLNGKCTCVAEKEFAMVLSSRDLWT